MNQVPTPISPDQVGRTTQIIAAALIMGLVTFGAIAFVMAQGKAPQLGFISYFAAGVFALNVVISLVLSKTTTSRAIREIAAQNTEDWRLALAPVYSSKMILANAPLEGAGFFNGVAHIIEGHWLNLAVMLCIVSLMAITFPSQSKFESWAEQVQRDNS